MLEGAWLWNLKDSIDRSFMRKYGDMLDEMRAKMMATADASRSLSSGGMSNPSAVYEASGLEALTVYAESKMRCGGCGAKVGRSAPPATNDFL